MPAECHCDRGHKFSSAVNSYDPELNIIDLEDEVCPECGANFEIYAVYDSFEDEQ